MKESTTKLTKRFTGCASLAAVGMKLKQLDLFGPIRQSVQINQKTVKYTPIDKLYDAFIIMLAGAHGLVEMNTRLRSDPARPPAFGRSSCAEQSVVQQTLDACTAENVEQMEQALTSISRQQSQGYRHDSAADWQVLILVVSSCGVLICLFFFLSLFKNNSTLPVIWCKQSLIKLLTHHSRNKI